jgi:ATP-dependent protease ClpP protease subunit
MIDAIQAVYIESGARIIVRGMCASAAVSILIGVPVHSRYATHDSRIILHEGRDLSGRRTLDADEKFAEELASGSCIDYDSARRVMRQGGTYELSPQDALKFGIIGRII